MSTNYYWFANPECAPIHVGKSSYGWCFSLHVARTDDSQEYRDGLPLDLDGWRALFARPGSFIRDEYGGTVTAEDMLSIITQRSRPKWTADGDWCDQNFASRGPNNLARLTHGHGRPGPDNETWDYCYGDFF